MISATAVVFVGCGDPRRAVPLAPGRIPADAWPYLVAIGFVSTFLAIQTFYAGARRIGAAQAALVSTVEPLIIVTLAAVLLDDVLAPVQLVGAGADPRRGRDRPDRTGRRRCSPSRPLDVELADESAVSPSTALDDAAERRRSRSSGPTRSR